MKLNIPYYRQKNIYSCGPAALQMVFSFLGKKETQKKLMKLADINKKEIKSVGIPNHRMVEAARRSKFYCYVNENSLLTEVKYYIQLGLPVIVSYIEPTYDDPHFGVVSGYSNLRRKIILNDPWNGKNFKMSEVQFMRRWYSGLSNVNHWMLVINKKPFKIGRQFFPLVTTATPKKPEIK